MTVHEFVELLSESYEFYGGWPGRAILNANLKMNTPAGQSRWDHQACSMLPRLVKNRLIRWIECPRATAQGAQLPAVTHDHACGEPHLELTAFGKAQLQVWNDEGCSVHRYGLRCHAPECLFKFEVQKNCQPVKLLASG